VAGINPVSIKVYLMHNWFVYKDFESLSQAAADFIENEIQSCLSHNDICHVALPGGNSPVLCLNLLAEKNLPWSKIHWYLGDERCYPQNHSERNDVMLQKNLWSRVGKTNIHLIPAELGAEKAAEVYREIIGYFSAFDLVFLGLGEDGHTASLFPGNDALDDFRSVIPVFDSPKPPSHRVSLSIETLKKARNRIILTSGVSKAEVIKRIKQGEDLPVNRIGDINWFIDETELELSSE